MIPDEITKETCLKKAEILLKATRNLLNKQNETIYVLNMLEETVTYYGVECDGSCLIEDIDEWLELYGIEEGADDNIEDEPNSSEKPNNCEKDCFLCKWLGDVDVCGRCRNRNLFAEADTEPTISKMEQVDKPIDRDDLGNCNICKYVGLEHRCNQCVNGSMFCKVEDEPQTERSE